MSAGQSTTSGILELHGVRRGFGGITAVDVDHISIPSGKMTALIGPNGAGKSTLFNIVTGFERHDAGRWSFDGRDVTGIRPHKLSQLGLVRSFQLTRLIPGTSVLDNMLLAAGGQRGERLALAGVARWWKSEERSNVERAEVLLEQFRLADKRHEDAAGLSGGQRRLLEVARALMAEPRALLLDEPLAGVNPALRETVMEHLVRLRDEGLSILFIEHDMDAVMGLSDYVVCMAAGKRIAEGTPAEVSANPQVVEAYLGVDDGAAAKRFSVTERPRGEQSAPNDEALLHVEDVTAGYVTGSPIVKNLSAKVDAGEIVAVIGANGAGKSTLLKAVAGMVRVTGGEVRIDSSRVDELAAHERVSAGLGFVPQSQNVFPSLTVLENLRMGGYNRPKSVSDDVDAVLQVFPELRPHLGKVAGALSGGQRQAVAMARALVGAPRILLLDEPSAGLSPGAQRSAFEHVRTVADTGVGVLIVEQNARACLAISHRAYVLEQGRVALTGRGHDLLHDQRVVDLYLGSLGSADSGG